MIENSQFQIQVNSGRKVGASHPIPLGELSIGTTLDSQFFIGCADMWHQLLRANASADLRSASPSGDVAPEQMMRVVITHDLNGLSLRVEQGFAEVGQRRLLPGDSCVVQVSSVVRIGASELEVLTVEPRVQEDDARSHIHVGSLVAAQQNQNGGLKESRKPSRLGLRFPIWLNGRAANAGLTTVAVAVLSLAMLNKPTTVSPSLASPEPATDVLIEQPEQSMRLAHHDGRIYEERIVAVVSSEPAFVMTESGQRYDIGAVVDRGFRISQIDKGAIEFTRGTETQSLQF